MNDVLEGKDRYTTHIMIRYKPIIVVDMHIIYHIFMILCHNYIESYSIALYMCVFLWGGANNTFSMLEQQIERFGCAHQICWRGICHAAHDLRSNSWYI